MERSCSSSQSAALQARAASNGIAASQQLLPRALRKKGSDRWAATQTVIIEGSLPLCTTSENTTQSNRRCRKRQGRKNTVEPGELRLENHLLGEDEGNHHHDQSNQHVHSSAVRSPGSLDDCCGGHWHLSGSSCSSSSSRLDRRSLRDSGRGRRRERNDRRSSAGSQRRDHWGSQACNQSEASAGRD